jgi:hypothetical protein
MIRAFIMIDDNNMTKKIVPAYDYQELALNDYIDNQKTGRHQYIINTSMSFYIDNFNSTGLNNDYSDFYSFIREDDTISIISRNEDKLRGFCGFRNRLLSI